MSNNRRHRRARRPFDRADLTLMATLAAKVAGCTCHPDLEHDRRHGYEHVLLRHDDDCPAIDAPGTWLAKVTR